jgi:hypothetical protein
LLPRPPFLPPPNKIRDDATAVLIQQ